MTELWRKTDFFSIILGLFVFNLRKYLFLFRNIMKMIGEVDSANEREKKKNQKRPPNVILIMPPNAQGEMEVHL